MQRSPWLTGLATKKTLLKDHPNLRDLSAVLKKKLRTGSFESLKTVMTL
jgi:hypothetical protein